ERAEDVADARAAEQLAGRGDDRAIRRQAVRGTELHLEQADGVGVSGVAQRERRDVVRAGGRDVVRGHLRGVAEQRQRGRRRGGGTRDRGQQRRDGGLRVEVGRD